jgi:hypothetical protein
MADQDERAAKVEAMLREAVTQAPAGPAASADADPMQVAARKIAEIFKQAPGEIDSGGAKTVIFGTSVNFGGTIWPLLSCGVAFLLAPLDPTGLTWGAAGGAVWTAIDKLRDVVVKLDPAQRVVCRAIIEVAADKKARNTEPEASEQDLVAYFKQRDEIVPVGLGKLLAGLVEKEVLSENHYPATGTYYRVVF